jgi:hypothetical protein
MRSPAICIGFLIACTAVASSGTSLRQVSGRYEVQSKCSTLGANGYEPCGPEVRDWLVLTWTSSTSASFDVYSVQVNGHQCSLSGEAELKGDSLVFVDPKAPTGDQGITISLVGSTIKFAYLPSEPSHQFRYCGSRATLNRVAFPLEGRMHE